MIFLLVKSKRAKDSYESQKILLKKIKSVISHRASKFNSYRQQVSSVEKEKHGDSGEVGEGGGEEDSGEGEEGGGGEGDRGDTMEAR